MSNLDRVARAVGFIEENLREELPVPAVAAAAGYSLYHFCRLFHGVTGYTPGEYILRRRLAEAARELHTSKSRIIDVALAYRFESHESFSRAMKRTFGLNPSELRRAENLGRLPLLGRLTPDGIRHAVGIVQHEPEIVELGPIHLVGLAFPVWEDLSVITGMWARFSRKMEGIPGKTTPARTYGLSFWSDDYEKPFFHLVAVEVASLAEIPPVLVGKTLPPARYLRFIHRGRSDQVGLTYRYIFQDYLPRSEHRLTRPYEFELYGEGYRGPENEASESGIYIPIGI